MQPSMQPTQAVPDPDSQSQTGLGDSFLDIDAEITRHKTASSLFSGLTTYFAALKAIADAYVFIFEGMNRARENFDALPDKMLKDAFY